MLRIERVLESGHGNSDRQWAHRLGGLRRSTSSAHPVGGCPAYFREWILRENGTSHFLASDQHEGRLRRALEAELTAVPCTLVGDITHVFWIETLGAAPLIVD